MADNKQRQLTFELGITNVPSDATCDDNALAESVGMVYNDGEHRVIQKPAEYLTIPTNVQGLELIYIHKVSKATNYIFRKLYHTEGGTEYYTLYWWDGDAAEVTLLGDAGGNVEVTSIGKTLIVKGLTTRYYLWKPSTPGIYEYLGENLPEIELEFYMRLGHWFLDDLKNYRRYCTKSSQNHDGCLGFSEYMPVVRDQEKYNNLVIGLYAENKRYAFQHGAFVNPFFIRYALELYDGSFTHMSAPVLMMPSVTTNSYAYFFDGESLHYVDLFTDFCYLFYKWNEGSEDLTKWSDIIKDVVVFVSDEVDVYDLAGDQTPQRLVTGETEYHWANGVYKYQQQKDGSLNETSNIFHQKAFNIPSSDYTGRYFQPLTHRPSSDILDDLSNVSIFYRAFAVGTRKNTGWSSASSLIKKHTLENIVNQQQLPDDYFSHCPLSAENSITYNARLLLSNITRGYYNGPAFMMPYECNTGGTITWSAEGGSTAASSHTWAIDVTIKTPSGLKTVRRIVENTRECIGRYYYFYPDPRATEAKFYCDGAWQYTRQLKEHKGLNGAYYLEALPQYGDSTAPSGSGTLPEIGTNEPENFTNEIWVSEANNPFVFKSRGNITVGNGDIIAISSITQALSQGQFGQYPLLVFTTEGIWAASTNSEGLFGSVHPMSREVINRPPCLVQTDGAVFFTSKKGLMVVVGSEVKCVSEQLLGKTNVMTVGQAGSEEVLVSDLGHFNDYLKEAFIAYDYRDSLLWIFDGRTDGTTKLKGSRYCYVYAIKNGTFARYDFGEQSGAPVIVSNVINNYPDYLLQIGSKLYSLTGRNDINNDTDDYSARLLSRAMKFGSGLTLKSIRQIRNVKELSTYEVKKSVTDPETGETTTVTESVSGIVKLRIFASNNLKGWRELRTLRSIPWKYFRFLFDFTGLKATDSFAGSVIITQERRTNKLR